MCASGIHIMEAIESENEIRELFGTCDLDGSGYIDRHELAAVCDLEDGDLSDVFEQLDLDNDGRISIDEFSEHFQRFSNIVAELKTAKVNLSSANRCKRSFVAFKKNVGIDLSLIPRYGLRVVCVQCRLYRVYECSQ